MIDQAIIQGATEKFRNGDLSGARSDCHQFFSLAPDPVRQAPLRFLLGAIEQRLGELPSAVEQFEIALQSDQSNPVWLTQTGLAHFKLNALDRAEYLYREALRLDPGFVVAHYNLGVLLQARRDWAGARHAFELAIEYRPQFAEALVNLANTLVELSEFEAAQAHYQRSLQINPRLANAHHGLGLQYLRKQEYVLAIRCFESAIEHDALLTDAWLDLADCYHLTGDLVRANVCVDHVLAREPNHEIARFKRAYFNGEKPSSAPPQLLSRLYAGMAHTFDEHLTQRLGYRIPELLAEELGPRLREFDARNGTLPTVLDLGCGTGLFGATVRQFASTLIGIDLSSAMLDKARARGVYDELVESELLAFLRRDDYLADLITATDVLIYVGELDALFARIPSHLNPAGIFAFSTESPIDLIDDFRLESTGRYSHHARYIERLATSNGLEIIKKIDTVIRTEMAVPLSGHVFILKKLARSPFQPAHERSH